MAQFDIAGSSSVVENSIQGLAAAGRKQGVLLVHRLGLRDWS